MKKMAVLSVIRPSLAFRGTVVTALIVAMSSRQVSGKKKVLLQSYLTILCRGLLVLGSASGALGAWGKHDERSPSTTPRYHEVPP